MEIDTIVRSWQIWTDASLLQTQKGTTLVSLAICGYKGTQPFYKVYVFKNASARISATIYEAYGVLYALEGLPPFDMPTNIVLYTDLLNGRSSLAPRPHTSKSHINRVLAKIESLEQTGAVEFKHISGSTNPAHSLAHNIIRAKGRPYRKDPKVFLEWEPGEIVLVDHFEPLKGEVQDGNLHL